MTIMGHPKYKITEGEILLQEGKTIHHIHTMTPDERAKLGIFLAFQHIPEIKGVKVFEFLRSIYDASQETQTSFLQFKKIIQPLLDEMHMDKELLRRDVNVGFSGGERRKLEILQLKLLKPKYIFLDEIDSGLDVDAFRQIATLLQSLMDKKSSFIVVTHYFTILDYIKIDHVYLMDKGTIIKEGGQEIADHIKKDGFKDIL